MGRGERVDKKYGKNIIGVIDKVTYYAQRRENSLTTSVTSPSGNWDIRLNYVTRYRVWHNSAKKLFMPFPLTQRPFAIDQRMV